jgi:Mg2+/Co2+ transporter CorB
MSKEAETLNIFIEQQQQKIKELTQALMISETKVKIMSKEIQDLKSINSQYKKQIDDKIVVAKRMGLSEIASSNADKPRVEEIPEVEKVKVNGFTTNRQKIYKG